MNTSPQQTIKFFQLLNPRLGLDLIVYTPEHIKNRLEWGDFFLKEIFDKGITLYER